MEENNNYLKYFITEDVYMVAEERSVELKSTTEEVVPSKSTKNEQLITPKVEIDSTVKNTAEVVKKTPVIEQPKIVEQKEAPKIEIDNVVEATKEENTKTPIIEQPEKAAEKSPAKETETTSTKNKKLLVVYEYKSAEALPVPLKQLMLKILEAVNVKVSEADFINASFKPAKEDLIFYENCLVFGYETSLYADKISTVMPYKIVDITGTKILKSDTLEDLNSTVLLKKRLWGFLQQMFPKS